RAFGRGSDRAFRPGTDHADAPSQPPSFLREGGSDEHPGAGMHMRIATRGSDLALTQARNVAAQLSTLGASTELVLVETAGDRSTAPFSAMPGSGFFTKAVQQAVLEGRADLAVHSHKDLPSAPVDGL